jgi:hypothetical protein
LAAFVTGVFVGKPRVFGTATDSDIVKTFSEKNILTMDSGSIVGMNGLIIGIAKLDGMQGTCLLGETSGYVVDAKASKQDANIRYNLKCQPCMEAAHLVLSLLMKIVLLSMLISLSIITSVSS